MKTNKHSGNYKSSDNKNYYSVGLSLKANEIHVFENFSCDADIMSFVRKQGLIIDKLYFNGNSPIPDKTKIPSKYHKLLN